MKSRTFTPVERGRYFHLNRPRTDQEIAQATPAIQRWVNRKEHAHGMAVGAVQVELDWEPRLRHHRLLVIWEVVRCSKRVRAFLEPALRAPRSTWDEIVVPLPPGLGSGSSESIMTERKARRISK